MTGHNIESAERQAALRRKVDAHGPDARTPEHPLLTLQSQIGNAQVARLLAQRESPDDDELQATHDESLQRETPHEDELQASHDLAQRESPDEDDLQAKHEAVGVEGGPVGPDTEQRIQSARGGGSALDATTRSSMESGFGTSFEDVRIHQDSESDVLTRRLTSHAFTTGTDIFLRSDASPGDNHLIAHELTHVVQQRAMGGGSGMSVGAAGDPHEHQADASAAAVVSGATAQPAAAQREAAEDDQLQADHDLSVQRESPEEEEVQASHDATLQREAAPDDDEVQASHDLSLQRESAEDQLAN